MQVRNIKYGRLRKLIPGGRQLRRVPTTIVTARCFEHTSVYKSCFVLDESGHAVGMVQHNNRNIVLGGITKITAPLLWIDSYKLAAISGEETAIATRTICPSDCKCFEQRHHVRDGLRCRDNEVGYFPLPHKFRFHACVPSNAAEDAARILSTANASNRNSSRRSLP